MPGNLSYKRVGGAWVHWYFMIISWLVLDVLETSANQRAQFIDLTTRKVL